MSVRAAIRLSTIPLTIVTTLLVTAAISGRGDATPYKIWIYFTDRGERSPRELAAAIEGAPLSARSLERRRLRGAGPEKDVHDLPVYDAYVERVRAEGCRIRHRSKYLNAVSALATPAQAEALRALPFVKKVTPVRRYHRSQLEDLTGGVPGIERSSGSGAVQTALDYGDSFGQLNQINVIPLHESGYHGEGVMVGVFDTGFMLRHEAFQHLDVEAQWDFIFDDGNTENEPEDPSAYQHNHGTQVLSALAGFKEGVLIGPAYAATYVLAKTERVYEEVIGEEDDFVRALEWADSIGVDIVSSSLGYYSWYDFADMDGNTAITTVACDIAAGRGITVCTAAGNERLTSWGHIIAPSDGDSVVAVGAVDAAGDVAYFSSPGPSADGRFKPDVSARGIAVTTVVATDSTGYTTFANGTSFATPLVAGACALIVQRNGDWGPTDVLDALRARASQSDSPDNDLGWGIIDALGSAVYDSNTGIQDAMALAITVSGLDVSGTIFNGFSTLQRVDLVRRRLRQDGNGYELPVTLMSNAEVPGSSATTFDDRLSAGGTYEYVVQRSDDPLTRSNVVVVTVQFGATLSQSAPNPFVVGSVAETAIDFSIGGAPPPSNQEPPIESYAAVRLEVFDARGARVATLIDDILSPGEYTAGWDGRSDRGNPVASGVYFYRLEAQGRTLTRKLVLISR